MRTITLAVLLVFLASGQMFAQAGDEWKFNPATGRNEFQAPRIRLRDVSDRDSYAKAAPAHQTLNPSDLPPPAPVFGTWEETARFLRGKRVWIGQPGPSDQLRTHLSLWAAQYYGRYSFGHGYYGRRYPYGWQVGTYSDFDPFLALGSHLQNFLGVRLQEWGLNTTIQPAAAEYRLEGEFVTFDEVKSHKGFSIPLIISIDNGREKFRMNLFLKLVEARTGDVLFRPNGLGELDSRNYRDVFTLFYSSSTRRETNAGPLAQQMVLAAIPEPPEPSQTQAELADLRKQVAQKQDDAGYLEEQVRLKGELDKARQRAEEAKKKIEGPPQP